MVRTLLPSARAVTHALPWGCIQQSLPKVLSNRKGRALQSTGLGRKAMHQVERAAASPPFNCTAIALDTVTGVYQGSEESLRGFYEDRGIPRPKVIRTNQEWYQRQGYEIIAMKEAMYDWTHPGTGVVFHIPGVYLKKELV